MLNSINPLKQFAQHLVLMREELERLGDILDGRGIAAIIDNAGLVKCASVAEALAVRLRELTTNSIYEESSYLEEAADLVDAAAINLRDAQQELDELAEIRALVEHPYGCPCDACVAMRSDEHYDRKRDGEMMSDGK